jgi:hypothetical protein
MRWSVGTLTSARRRADAVVSRSVRSLRTPAAQLLSAIGGMCGGAALIGPWMVGIVLMLGSAAWGADAFLRDDTRARPQVGTHPAIERWRRAS